MRNKKQKEIGQKVDNAVEKMLKKPEDEADDEKKEGDDNGAEKAAEEENEFDEEDLQLLFLREDFGITYDGRKVYYHPKLRSQRNAIQSILDVFNSQAKLLADKKKEEEEEKERKYGDKDDFVFSVTRKYEKVEINLQKLKSSGCSYALFHVKIPNIEHQLKDSTVFLKKKKNETQQQKLIVKKQPRTTRFLTRIYDKKTKTELCRFSSDLPKAGEFKDSDLEGMVSKFLFFFFFCKRIS